LYVCHARPAPVEHHRRDRLSMQRLGQREPGDPATDNEHPIGHHAMMPDSQPETQVAQ
jgi:hypothetical protein